MNISYTLHSFYEDGLPYSTLALQVCEFLSAMEKPPHNMHFIYGFNYPQ